METAPALDGEALREARQNAGLSQNQLARLADLASGDRISKWERGEARPRSPHALHAVARVLEIEARDLLLPESEPNLRWLRFAAGLTVADLATATHCATSTVKRWEAVGLVEPSDAVVSALAAALRSSPDEVRIALRP